jgi:hypothetical protein
MVPGAMYPMVPLIATEEVQLESTKDDAVESILNLANPKSPT